MFSHVSPASGVFHTPPPVVPWKKVKGLPGMPATAVDLPPRNGPTNRNFMAEKSAGSKSSFSEFSRASGRLWARATDVPMEQRIKPKKRAGAKVRHGMESGPGVLFGEGEIVAFIPGSFGRVGRPSGVNGRGKVTPAARGGTGGRPRSPFSGPLVENQFL